MSVCRVCKMGRSCVVTLSLPKGRSAGLNYTGFDKLSLTYIWLAMPFLFLL